MSSHEAEHKHGDDCHHDDKGKKCGPVLAPGLHAAEGHDHDHKEGECHESHGEHHETKVHLRKGLACNPDNHFNQKLAAEAAEHHEDDEPPKAHTHARQGHAANPDNHQH